MEPAYRTATHANPEADQEVLKRLEAAIVAA
jgi:hypothetical protein